jgi:DNA polymerase (family X)
MHSDQIAKAIKITAQLMELHEQNPFKIKSLASAAFNIDKLNVDLSGKTLDELEALPGVGKSIAAKMIELNNTETLQELNQLLVETPVGVIEMLSIKGIGPKKVRQLWKELEIESIGELLYACNENRLVTLKGFGQKTQEEIKKQILFLNASKGKCLFAEVEQYANELIQTIKNHLPNVLVELTGQMRRKCEIIDVVEILIGTENQLNPLEIMHPNKVKIELIYCKPDLFYKMLFEATAASDFPLSTFNYPENIDKEESIFTFNHLQYIAPELRENAAIIALASENKIPELITYADLKGTLHNHSTYSDGSNSLKDMALYCKLQGWEYLGICDHSQSAFYANGLKPDRVAAQHAEIEHLNKELFPFKIFKGIESDILYDGSLDYDADTLKSFDFIVASVHSVLKMNEEKATQRLITAIENPYTTILGHPTGRLLLSRQGYPINHKKVIDACAANGVVVELNANPYRLDIDWRWIPYCLEKGVMISINPDAHETAGFFDMHFGTLAARKGMLSKEKCFNVLNLEQISKHFASKNTESIKF